MSDLQSAGEKDSGIPWYERPAPPNHARVQLLLDDVHAFQEGSARSPVTLCDVPIDRIVTQGAQVQGTITVTVYRHDIYRFVDSHGIRNLVPADSPFLMQVPEGKFMLPPKFGQVRIWTPVPVDIAADESSAESLRGNVNVPYADIDGDELSASFERRPPDFEITGTDVVQLKDKLPHLRIRDDGVTISLDNLARLGITPDPQALRAQKLLEMRPKTASPVSPPTP